MLRYISSGKPYTTQNEGLERNEAPFPRIATIYTIKDPYKDQSKIEVGQKKSLEIPRKIESSCSAQSQGIL